MRLIHERTLVICMIETRAGLDNVEAIAAVDGVDVIWLGHFDLTNFLGIPANFSHPMYREAVKRIADAARAHGKAAGYMAADAALGREYLQHGYRMIATGTDQAHSATGDRAADLGMETFRVGVTSDILDSRGEPAFGREPLKALDAVQWEWLPKGLREITADLAATYDALYVNSPKVPAAAVARPDLRLKLISRHGVGYDSVDVDAMTKAGVLVANTPNAVPRPVATIALTFVLALAHRLMAKDRITRAGRWAERLEHMGTGLTGRTLGVIGAGRIGKELLRLSRPFDLKLLAADPYAETLELNYIGARHVGLRR